MNPTRQAIGELLEGDQELGQLCTVHYGSVDDQELEPPFCIFHMDGGSEIWAMGASGMDFDAWIVKGVSPDPSVAEEIDLRCKALLNGTELGGSHKFCRSESPIAYDNIEGGTTYHFRGTRYRVVVENV